MARNDTSYKFYFHKLHESWRRGKPPLRVSYQAYTQDPNLCIAKTLDEYISGTEGWNSGVMCSQPLNFINQHRTVVSSTILDWLKIFSGKQESTKVLSSLIQLHQDLGRFKWRSN